MPRRCAMSIRARLSVAVVLVVLVLCAATSLNTKHPAVSATVCFAGDSRPQTAARFYAHASAKLLADKLPPGESFLGYPRAENVAHSVRMEL